MGWVWLVGFVVLLFFSRCVHCVCNCLEWWHLHKKLVDRLLQYGNFTSSVRLRWTFFWSMKARQMNLFSFPLNSVKKVSATWYSVFNIKFPIFIYILYSNLFALLLSRSTGINVKLVLHPKVTLWWNYGCFLLIALEKLPTLVDVNLL